MKKHSSMKRKERTVNSLIYVLLTVISIVWVLPIILIVYTSLRPENGMAGTLFPKDPLTFDHYVTLFTNKEWPFLKWFGNTLIVAVFTTIISTFFVLSVSYTMSRLRFKSRKKMMSINLILGMFPGFMSMIAVYNILKMIPINGDLGLTQSLTGLIIVYSASSGMGFYIAKGFFDTVSKSLDEAARIDGATNAQIFYKIIIPLSKPIIIYTIITTFMGPWMDFIFSSILIRNNTDKYTVALGLYRMIGTQDNLQVYFTTFFAGAVVISIPIMIVFLATQKYYVSGVTGGAVKG